MNNLEVGFVSIGFALGALVGLVVSMAVSEISGSGVESGTVVYPNEQQCIIETGRYCHFERVGIYVANKDEAL